MWNIIHILNNTGTSVKMKTAQKGSFEEDV